MTLSNSEIEAIVKAAERADKIELIEFIQPDDFAVFDYIEPSTIQSLCSEILKLREVVSQYDSQCSHMMCPHCVAKVFKSEEAK